MGSTSVQPSTSLRSGQALLQDRLGAQREGSGALPGSVEYEGLIL